MYTLLYINRDHGRQMQLRKRNGYTLVETLVSVAIGIFVLTAVGASMDNGVFLATDNRSRIYGLNALREELEVVRRMNYDSFTALGASSTFTNAQIGKLRNGSGTRTVVAGSGPDIKKLTLRVNWTSRKGRALSESLTTYVTRKGVNGS